MLFCIENIVVLSVNLVILKRLTLKKKVKVYCSNINCIGAYRKKKKICIFFQKFIS